MPRERAEAKAELIKCGSGRDFGVNEVTVKALASRLSILPLKPKQFEREEMQADPVSNRSAFNENCMAFVPVHLGGLIGLDPG
jgi:hypothetical protein